jgi:hypothetical protein
MGVAVLPLGYLAIFLTPPEKYSLSFTAQLLHRYELQREANIRRNMQILGSLGLGTPPQPHDPSSVAASCYEAGSSSRPKGENFLDDPAKVPDLGEGLTLLLSMY